MKKNNYLYFLSILVLSAFLFSCGEDENLSDSDDSGSGSIKNNLKTGQIEIKAYPDKNNKISFYATATSLTIDWGDGSVEEYTPNGIRLEFTYEYVNSNFQTIKVNTNKITHFNISDSSSKGIFHELRFGDCSYLEEILCSGSNTKLTVLSIKSAPALTTLDCIWNQLTSLDVSGCVALTSLGCEGNQLTSLNVSGCTALTSLDCYGNQLTSLDASGCTALTTLYCQNNQLTSLDVSGCTALTGLFCSDNQLTSLDVSGCTALTRLFCSDNQLTSLDVSGCVALTGLGCVENQLSSTALNSLFESLPTRQSGNNASISVGGNPGIEYCDWSIATNKGWTVYR